ncbi:Na+/H+ antiporter subunit G [Rhodococcus rhodnii]|uniref:Uncharacterized protein n=2 Tax=Rhodococcus rhodnii TaxID=38312 RepID=R7WGU9_9NOCA|nr:monovalent cation/H(+) antiporter subunit G [Rhodococcus rhodnii]EOM74320.1 hypothetical protein Rrhod_4464 [Rhodococcus rhodnii LMG 5362]TXG89546.1 Na+/H+ antiporter subunit G [Rhodococcus rhodnii]
MILDALTVILVSAGLVFFTAGTIGLLRFPDLHSRLHALTKADNLGLGLILLGLMAQVDSFGGAAKLLLVWLFALVAGATNGIALAGRGGDRGGESS